MLNLNEIKKRAILLSMDNSELNCKPTLCFSGDRCHYYRYWEPVKRLYFSGVQHFTKNFWEKTPIIPVNSLPLDIDGKCVYQIPYQRDQRMKATTDGRPWERDMSIKWKGAEKGSVRAKRCKGSHKCENPKCSFGKNNMIKLTLSSLRKIMTTM